MTSCERWGIELLVEGVCSKGSWEENCSYKPTFILEKLEALKRPVFWADADSVFLKKPDFSSFLSYDISVRRMEIFQNDPRYFFNTASFFANYTPKAIELMKAWSITCALDPSSSFLDQIALYHVLEKIENIRIYSMPVAYCKIYDLDTFFLNDEDVVLEQTQASRRHRSFYEQ